MKRVWEGGDRQISYSSPTVATLAGVLQILSVNEDTVSGHEPETGRVLWEQPWAGNSTGAMNASQAMPVLSDRFFVSKSYGGGAALYTIVDGASAFAVKEIWKSNRVMRTRFTNVVITGGHIYGLSDGILECIRLEDGERVWKEGRYGHGQILLTSDAILVMTESGEIVLVDASPERHRVLARFQALEGTSWNNLALSGPHLLVRNAAEAACYRLPLEPEARTTR